MKNVQWAPIWEDKDFIQKIKVENGFYRKRKDLDIKVKTPFIEIGSRGSDFQRLDLTSAIELSKKLEIVNKADIFKKISQMEYFKPFVVQVEGSVEIAYDLEKIVTAGCEILLSSSNLDSKTRERIKKFLESNKVPPFKNDKLYIEILQTFDKQTNEKIIDYAAKKKILKEKDFLGKKYVVYFFNPQDPLGILPVYVPIEAKSALPSYTFMGRIIGVLYFDANPIRKDMHRILRAASISVGFMSI